MAEELPVAVSPEEIIVRAVKSPYHVKRADGRVTLRYQAFKPQPGRDDVSVMRKRHLGNDGCKRKAVDICGTSYIGLAALSAQDITDAKARVVDSRAGQFLGHAHIEQGIPAPPKGETADPDLIERWQGLANTARFYPDGNPADPGWTGPDIV